MTTSTTLYYDKQDTPIGSLILLSDGENVLRIDYGTLLTLEVKWLKWTKRYFGKVTFVHNSAIFKEVKEELTAYFSGDKKTFTFSYNLKGTPFQKKVWRTLTDTVYFGETKTYKEIAESIGNPKAVRAVGGAVNKNPLSIVIPCHRVIGSDGKMIGYNGGLDKKEYLLAFEEGNQLKAHQMRLKI